MAGNIAKRDDGRWRARYRDPAGKEHAQRWLDSVTSSIVEGNHVDPRAAQVVFASVADSWATNPGWSESTRARNVGILRHHVLPRWGAVRLDRITYDDAQAWVNGLAASGLAGASVRKVAGVFSGVLTSAVRGKRLRISPADSLALPRQALARRRYLTARQVEGLAEASGEWGDLVQMLAYTGLRFGEAAALRVRSVDILRRRLTVEESVTEVDGRLVWSAPKDHQRRSVPFPAFLAPAFEGRMAGKSPDSVLFETAAGSTLRVRNMRRDWFDRATSAAGLAGLTPHELRHTAASLAVGARANVLAVQRMLGHEKPSTTLDVYSDLFDGDLDAVAEALEGARTSALADYLRTSGPTPLRSRTGTP
jgi:integrase